MRLLVKDDDIEVAEVDSRDATVADDDPRFVVPPTSDTDDGGRLLEWSSRIESESKESTNKLLLLFFLDPDIEPVRFIVFDETLGTRGLCSNTRDTRGEVIDPNPSNLCNASDVIDTSSDTVSLLFRSIDRAIADGEDL